MNALRILGPATLIEIGKFTVIRTENLYRYIQRLINAGHVTRITGKDENGKPLSLFQSERGCYLGFVAQKKRIDRQVSPDEPIYTMIDINCPICGTLTNIMNKPGHTIVCETCKSELTFNPPAGPTADKES